MEQSLIALLLADATLQGLVSDRIWWVRRPQSNSDVPTVVLTKVSAVRQYTMSAPSGLVESRVQADIFAESYASARSVFDALRAILNGYQGVHAGTTFQGIFLETERDTNETESDARHLFLTSLDLTIWHD